MNIMTFAQYTIMAIVLYVFYNKFASTPNGKIIINNTVGGIKKLFILIKQLVGILNKNVTSVKKEEKVKKIGQLETY